MYANPAIDGGARWDDFADAIGAIPFRGAGGGATVVIQYVDRNGPRPHGGTNVLAAIGNNLEAGALDRKSTRLNSSH